MTDFAKENLNFDDYDSLNAIWEHQLKQLGYCRGWDENGVIGWRPSDDMYAPVQSAYDAWREATGTPDDLGLGITHEPTQPPYHKPA